VSDKNGNAIKGRYSPHKHSAIHVLGLRVAKRQTK